MDHVQELRSGGADCGATPRGRARRYFGIGLLSTLPVLAACQTYRPAPVDEAAHRARWHGAGPESAQQHVGALPDDGLGAASEPPRAIDRSRAAALALANHGALRLLRLEREAAGARVAFAGGLGAPSLEGEVRRAESGSDPWIVAAGLGIAIPLTGRRAAERAAAEAHWHSLGFAVLELEADVALELDRRWWAHGAARRRESLWQRQTERWTGWAAKLDSLADAGEVAPSERLWLDVAQQEQRVALERARAETESTGAQLWTYLGLAPEHREEFSAVWAADSGAAELPVLPESAGTEWIDRHPRMLRLREEYRVAEANLRLEIALQVPDLVLGPSVESDEGRFSVGLFGALGLPVFRANRLAIENARHERDRKRVELELAYESFVAQRAELEAEEQALRRLDTLLRDDLEPRARIRAEQSWQLVGAGEAPVPLALEAEHALHQIELEHIDLLRARAELGSALTHLVGAHTTHGPSSTDTTSEWTP